MAWGRAVLAGLGAALLAGALCAGPGDATSMAGMIGGGLMVFALCMPKSWGKTN